MMLVPSLGPVSLSVRHINTIKSGLIVHLYNIEEAIMSQGLQYLGDALGLADPRSWTEHSLKEWLRKSVVSRISEGNEDGRLKTVHQMSALLLSNSVLGPQSLKKPSGTWDDKAIATFIDRMKVRFEMPEEMWRSIAPNPGYTGTEHRSSFWPTGETRLPTEGVRLKMAQVILGLAKFASLLMSRSTTLASSRRFPRAY